MSEKKKKKKPEPEPLKLSEHFKFEPMEIDRSEVKKAPYNPRIISDAERAKLRASVEAHGIVEPLIWNKRTGNLVGGHQRIGILDTLEGSQKYRLRVAMIDVDEKREKELNVVLNNQSAMGRFDMDALEGLLKDPDLNIHSMGFDSGDVFQMFGDSVILDQPKHVKELAEKLRKVEDASRNARGNSDRIDMNNHDYYFVVVFPDQKTRDLFMDRHGWTVNKFLAWEELDNLITKGK
jgi:hypothetical protein